MMIRRILLAAVLTLSTAPALAIDPGVASGHYTRDGVRMDFKYSLALNQDDAEGLLDHGPQIRLLLSDREVPLAALIGPVFPPIRNLARKGEVRGVIVEFSPKDKTQVQVTVLDTPTEPGAFAPNISMSNSEGLWTRLDTSATRVAGELKSGEQTDLAFSFSAPVFNDPVVADLKGPPAVASEPVKTLLARAQAIATGDKAQALALSSRGSAAQMDEIFKVDKKMLAQQAGFAVKSLKSAKRVVIREQSAVVLVPDGGFFNLVREDGAWKAAD